MYYIRVTAPVHPYNFISILITYLISRFKIMTRHTAVFPRRFVITVMVNIMVIPIWAASESVYCDIAT